MIDPKLMIQGVSIAVGQSINGLKQAGFKRDGLIASWMPLARARKRGLACDAVHSVVNPQIELFGDPDARLVGLDPHAAGRENCYGTLAQVYSRNGIITAIHLLLFRSSAHGLRLKQAARRWASKEIGPGTRSPIRDMPRLMGERVRKPGFEYMLWADASSHLLFRGVTASRSCYLFWEGRAVPGDVARLCPERLEDLGGFGDAHGSEAVVETGHGSPANLGARM